MMTAKITLGSTRGTVENVSSVHQTYIAQALQFEDRVPSGHQGETVVYKDVYGYSSSLNKAFFKNGFLYAVVKLLVELGYTVEYNDRRVFPELSSEQDFDFFGRELYAHQKEAILAMRDRQVLKPRWGATEVAHPIGIIDAATNAGKDVIMMGLFTAYPKARCLMLVDSVSIANKAVASFKDAGFKVSTVLSGAVVKSPKDVQKITVATPEAFANQVDKGKSWLLSVFGVLAVDECHMVSNTFNKLLARVDAPVRYGFSGTPLSSEFNIAKAKVKEFLGPPVFSIKNKDLIVAGVSREPELHFHVAELPPIPELEGSIVEYLNGLPYQQQEQLSIVDNKLFHYQIVNLVQEYCDRSGRTVPTVVFVKRLDHGYALKKAFEYMGFSVAFANGVEKNTTSLVESFNSGKLDVLIGNKVLATGLNMGRMELAILAAGGKSEIQVLQSLGRANRKKEGFATIPVVDFWFHSGPQQKHNRVRIGIYKAQNYKVHFYYNHHPRYYTPIP